MHLPGGPLQRGARVGVEIHHKVEVDVNVARTEKQGNEYQEEVSS